MEEEITQNIDWKPKASLACITTAVMLATFVDVLNTSIANVALKTIEGCSMMLFKLIQQEFKTDLVSKIVGLLAKPFMKRIYKRINYEEFGGALLLGVKGITVISHGRSSSYAIKNAVRVAKEAVESGVNKKIAELVS